MSENQTQAEKKENNNFNLADEILEWVEAIAFALFITMFIFTFILRMAYVDGKSMYPTFDDKDKVVVSNFLYTPEVGDIVVAYSDSYNEFIVKRVIAAEGQTVDIDFEKGKVAVDGNVLNEPYINEPTYRNDQGHQYPVTVPEDSFFLMGDNRNHSVDSRNPRISFVDKDHIRGRVIFRLEPFNKFGIVK